MDKIGMIKIAVSSLVLAATLTPLNATTQGGSAQEQMAAKAAQRATDAVAKRKFAEAIRQAEAAVAAMPRDAGYRALLGQAYLSAGRFASAETMLGDAAALDPSNARTGLKLALAQIANGHNDRASATLDAYRDRMSPADFGLATALSGDVQGAIRVLEDAVRADDATVQSRQNLALAYAMSGRWAESRVMVSQDLSPSLVGDRMAEWAQFVQPQSAASQVASIMRVTPAFDPGQPQALALAPSSGEQQVVAVVEKPVPPPVAAPAASFSSEPAPVFEVAGGQAQAAAPVAAPEPVAVASAPETVPAPVAQPAAVASADGVIWGKYNPVVQPIPASVRQPSLIPASYKPMKQVIRPVAAKAERFRPVEGGQFVVQLGAYSNAAVAESAWNNKLSRNRLLTGFNAVTARITLNNATYYRLSVSGFATRASANQLCARVKAAGGQCFVRAVAGDAPLQWAQRAGGTRIAARK